MNLFLEKLRRLVSFNFLITVLVPELRRPKIYFCAPDLLRGITRFSAVAWPVRLSKTFRMTPVRALYDVFRPPGRSFEDFSRRFGRTFQKSLLRIWGTSRHRRELRLVPLDFPRRELSNEPMCDPQPGPPVSHRIFYGFFEKPRFLNAFKSVREPFFSNKLYIIRLHFWRSFFWWWCPRGPVPRKLCGPRPASWCLAP